MGPFLIEFQRHGMAGEEFIGKLDLFFSRLPTDFSYYLEIRNAGLLGQRYHDMVKAHGVAHVYNHWSYMPFLTEQHQRMGGCTAPFTVLRLPTPSKMTCEAAKKRAEPHNKIVGELPECAVDAPGGGSPMSRNP